jgi:hypothetical protein
MGRGGSRIRHAWMSSRLTSVQDDRATCSQKWFTGRWVVLHRNPVTNKKLARSCQNGSRGGKGNGASKASYSHNAADIRYKSSVPEPAYT